ncbi:MAG: hypothetical protein AAFN74_24550 [Myxococcota bacterium]
MDGSTPPSPHTEALDALWSSYRSKWRRLLSRNAVQELRLRASFDVDLLAHWRMKNRTPAGTIPDCPNCNNICCAGLENVVSLRLKDVACLIDIGRTDLMSKKKPNFPRSMLVERPGLRELVASELWRTLPVLRQTGDLKVCAALGPDLKCTLYPNWPLTCERFPYTLNVMRKQVTWGTRCPSRQRDSSFEPRRKEMYKAALNAYDERVKDAVLLAHARKELDAAGIGEWLVKPDENPFEETPRGLPIIQ